MQAGTHRSVQGRCVANGRRADPGGDDDGRDRDGVRGDDDDDGGDVNRFGHPPRILPRGKCRNGRAATPPPQTPQNMLADGGRVA